MNFEEGFLKDIVLRLQSYKDLGEKSFAQLNEADFFFHASPESNNIAIIIQHLHGNMMSRFTDFLTEDGEKPWRRRDEEFEPAECNKDSLLALWHEGWSLVFNTISELKPDELMKIISIRNEQLTIYDALLRSYAHISYHIGQIVFIGKMIKDKEWQSLSIPKRRKQ